MLPNVTAATARIKVEAVGNVFFDVSHADFAIVAGADDHRSAARSRRRCR